MHCNNRVSGMKQPPHSVVAYPGTFDPITNGHIDIIKKARDLFPVVKVIVARETDKDTFFSYEERVRLVKEAVSDLKGVECDGFEGLLINYLRDKEINIVIRGLRAVSDFDYEFQMALTNRKLYPSIEFVFLMPGEEYFFLSSSLIKKIALLGGEIGCFVPRVVEKGMKRKVKEQV